MTAGPVVALGTDDLTTVGIVTTLVLVVVGGLLVLLITKLIARVVILIVVVALAVLVWQQRSHVENKIKQHCELGATYFGVHVDAPQSVRQKCRASGT